MDSYKDTGCDLSPSCLDCPFPQCRLEIDEKAERNAEIYELSIKEDWSINALAREFGLSSRTILRILKKERLERKT